MELAPLHAISPIDGRYWSKVESLHPYFSEAALFKYRTYVEVEYFIALCELPLPELKEVDNKVFPKLRDVYKSFSTEDAQQIKKIEKKTNHDVKAVEYFLKQKLEALGLGNYTEFIHFGLTSQDINNTALPKSLQEGLQEVYFPQLTQLAKQLEKMAEKWASIPMLARTHGQPASPTRFGKEIKVFLERLQIQGEQLKKMSYPAKFGGATGNFNAHHAAYPSVDWKKFADSFVQDKLGLHRSQTTTQIEHYDNLAAIFHGLSRINTILLDLSRDFWTYISMNYFTQKIKKGEVGSSTMPHKVNPIDFENAEGNLGIANAIYEHLSRTLPISRLQRDLSDSTTTRNIGVPVAHSLLALKSLQKGLGKLKLNEKEVEADLEKNWAVVAEAIQTILRREGYANPYETLKKLTRSNKPITKGRIKKFIDALEVSDKVKKELRQITPYNYTGI